MLTPHKAGAPRRGPSGDSSAARRPSVPGAANRVPLRKGRPGTDCMMIPTVARATEEMLLMVPNVIREAAYGLGIPKWRTTLSISLRTASAGVITGCMLAFARVAGETAPLLFTAFGNQFWNLKLNQPTAAL